MIDPDGPTPSFSYQWQVATSANGTYTDISGATTETYTIAENGSQNGKFFKVAVNAQDGMSGGTTFTSSATAAVANTEDAATGSVSISGSVAEGGTLTAVTSGDGACAADGGNGG